MSTLYVLSQILQQYKVKKVLDLGCGKGNHSLLCASYGADVDAVDPNIRNEFKWQEHLDNHPHIIHHVCTAEEYKSKNQYDLIIFLNVINFMDKEHVIKQFLPSLSDKLSDWWVLLISFLTWEHESIGNQVFYTKDEIEPSLWLNTIDSFTLTKEQNHPKHWWVSLASEILIMQKKVSK